MKYVFLLSMAFLSFYSFSMKCILVEELQDSMGNTLCSYSNGTVLNVGIRLCPLNIDC